VLHRRLHHRLMKFFSHIEEATKDLPDYVEAEENEGASVTSGHSVSVAASASGKQVICLLSSDSSDTASETDDE